MLPIVMNSRDQIVKDMAYPSMYLSPDALKAKVRKHLGR